MKLKFEAEIKEIIELISQLPDTATGGVDLSKPLTCISEFDRKLFKQKDDKPSPIKQWVKLRRQLSFLYEFVHASGVNADKLIESENVLQRQYRFLVKSIKDIHTGKALQNPGFVKIALRYGVLHLSDFEIKKLIDGNII